MKAEKVFGILLILLAIYLGVTASQSADVAQALLQGLAVALTVMLGGLVLAAWRTVMFPERLKKHAARAQLDHDGTTQLMVAYIELVRVVTITLAAMIAAGLFGINV